MERHASSLQTIVPLQFSFPFFTWFLSTDQQETCAHNEDNVQEVLESHLEFFLKTVVAELTKAEHRIKFTAPPVERKAPGLANVITLECQAPRTEQSCCFY